MEEKVVIQYATEDGTFIAIESRTAVHAIQEQKKLIEAGFKPRPPIQNPFPFQ